MPSASLSLKAKKSQAYFNSLCKHFARKVEVVRDENSATVAFPMGSCRMSVCEMNLNFDVNADNEASLNAVKKIVSDHVVRFGELKNAKVCWIAGPSEVEVKSK